MNKPFDPQWVINAKHGDQDAITELYTCAWKEVSIVIQSMIRTDGDTVQDLMQDTFVKAFQRLDQLDDPQKYNAWIKQIARTTTLDYLKKSRAILFSELHDDDSIPIEIEDEDLSHMPDIALDKQETVRLLREILNSLPDRQRIVLTMHYIQELSVKEIAQLLDRSENTIKVQLRNGRRNLERKVRELEQKEDIKLYSFPRCPSCLYCCTIWRLCRFSQIWSYSPIFCNTVLCLALPPEPLLPGLRPKRPAGSQQNRSSPELWLLSIFRVPNSMGIRKRICLPKITGWSFPGKMVQMPPMCIA